MKRLFFFLLCFVLLSLTRQADASVPGGGRGTQTPVFSAQCPTGGPEGVALFEQAKDYTTSRRGVGDQGKAIHLYEEAIRLGNARAMLNLGVLYREWHDDAPNPETYRELGVDLFLEAWEAGCPEALGYLAGAYSEGWGVRRNPDKALRLVEMAAEAGSLQAMVEYGDGFLCGMAGGRVNARCAEGKALMERALAQGYGYAGYLLGMNYGADNEPEDAIRALRTGAALGSKDCVSFLAMIYRTGENGQEKDEAYADKLDALWESIDESYDPAPIPDFEQRFPPKPVLFSPSLPKGRSTADPQDESFRENKEGILKKLGRLMEADDAFARAEALWQRRAANGAGGKKAPPAKAYPKAVYGQLEVRNQCFQPVYASATKWPLDRMAPGGSRLLASRSSQKFFLWKGERAPESAFTFHTPEHALALRESQGENGLPLREILASAEQREFDFGVGRMNIWETTLCPQEIALDEPAGFTKRPAVQGEKLDRYEMLFTQIPGSRKPEYVYQRYPIDIAFGGMRLGTASTDDAGMLILFFPAGTKGSLELEAPFGALPPYRLDGQKDADPGNPDGDTRERLSPVATVTATGAETVLLPARPRLGADAF
jgi:hypothetical protein